MPGLSSRRSKQPVSRRIVRVLLLLPFYPIFFIFMFVKGLYMAVKLEQLKHSNRVLAEIRQEHETMGQLSRQSERKLDREMRKRRF